MLAEKRGHPKKFKYEEKLIYLFMEFCDFIISEDYRIIPSQTEFCKWLANHYENTDRKTIYNSLNKYFPTIKKEFERLQSDLIAQGGMLGKYRNAMAIFVLKNWCKWEDKASPDSSENGQQAHNELMKAIKRISDED